VTLGGSRQGKGGASSTGAWLLFGLLVGLAFLLVFTLAERAGQRERLLDVPTAVPMVPAAALSDRQDWLENGALRFGDADRSVPAGWQGFAITDAGARIYRAAGESFLRLECVEETCIAGLWQRLPDLAAGDYLFEADVYLEAGEDGSVSARLGYDGTGGVDPLSPGVRWSARAQGRGWQRLHLEVPEDGGPGTVFLVLDVLSPGADCRVAGVRLLGPPGMLRPPAEAAPTVEAVVSGTDVEYRAAYLSLTGADLTDESELVDRLDGLAAAHLNVVFVQARHDGLAYYDSPLEPPAPGLAVEGGGVRWDPLARAVALGHERGMQVHAWLELLPVWSAAPDAPAPPGSHLLWSGAERLGEDWRQVGTFQGRILASPTSIAVQAYLASLCADLAKRYGVDGLHLSGLVVTGVDEAAADGSLTALLTEVATQARAARPGLALTIATEAVPAAEAGEPADTYSLSPAGAWRVAGLADAVVVRLDADSAGSRSWLDGGGAMVLARLEVRARFADLAQGIYSARKAGAVGVVLDDTDALLAAHHQTRLAEGPFLRPALVPPTPGG